MLETFCHYIENQTGWHFTKDGRDNLQKKLEPLVDDLGFKDPENDIQILMKTSLTKDQTHILARHLTIGETYFFRDKNLFETLEKVILPELIKKKELLDKSLKIWCAACSTGEEPYSIAILLSKLIPFLDAWNVQIIGTDINPYFLQKAKLGEYKEWSFRGLSESLKKQYFKKSSTQKYTLNADIKSMVSFEYINLVDDSYPSLISGIYAVDLIICNNVLIYFSKDQIQKVIKKVSNSLREGGCLIVTPIEAPYVKEVRLKNIPSLGSHYYFKSSHIEDKPIPLKKIVSKFLNNFSKSSRKPAITKNAGTQKEPVNAKDSLSEASLKSKILEKEAEVFYKEGRYQEVISFLNQECFYKGQKLFDGSAFKHLGELIVKSFANTGQPAKALEFLKELIQQNKLDPHLHFLQGSIFQEIGQNKDAQQAFKKTLFLDPQFVLAYFSLGNLYLKEGNTKASTLYFRNALEILERLKPEDVLQGEGEMTADRLKNLISIMQVSGTHI